MALDTAPSFGGGGANMLSGRIAKQRPTSMRPQGPMGPPMGGPPGRSMSGGASGSGIARSPFMNFGFDGAKPMGNMGAPKSMSMGYNPAGGMRPPPSGPMGRMPGGPSPMRVQGDPLMAAGGGGGMVADNAPPMMGGGFNPNPATGGERFMAPQGGGMMPEGPTEMGGPGGIMSRYRNMDPRFRY